jgi:hypothetical protein
MLADVLTKALGEQLFHDLVKAMLSKHHFPHSSNRGAKRNVTALSDVDAVTPELAKLSCSNHEQRAGNPVRNRPAVAEEK